MIFGLLVTLYIFSALLLALLILVQKGKGSMGLGNLGGGTQLLFGGSGGQDLFQKITWGLGAVFIGGSLILSILKTKQYQQSRYLIQTPQAVQKSVVPSQPLAPTEGNAGEQPIEQTASTTASDQSQQKQE